MLEQYVVAMRMEGTSSNYEKSVNSTINALAKFVQKDFREVTADDVLAFLNHYKKPEPIDPLHKWIGTYNIHLAHLIKFFKWLYYPDIPTEQRPKPPVIRNLRKIRRKEKSSYKPTDLWTIEDDLLFLKYCPSKREKCYHAISRDSSCRPHEILKLRIKDVNFKMADNKQYAEVLVNGKTGSRHIPLINSIPYLKDWLDDHPFRTNPSSPLICGFGKSLGKYMAEIHLWKIYDDYKTQMFPKLLDNPTISYEDKLNIAELLKKPWNPYIRRHSALTEKSKFLKESILRQHAGWTKESDMPSVYLHYFGNESSESILEAFGLKAKPESINKMKPKQCPNCNESCKVDAKFCPSCRMVLSYDAYTETVEEKIKKEDELGEIKQQVQEIFNILKETKDPDKHTEFAGKLYKSGLIHDGN